MNFFDTKPKEVSCFCHCIGRNFKHQDIFLATLGKLPSKDCPWNRLTTLRPALKNIVNQYLKEISTTLWSAVAWFRILM